MDLLKRNLLHSEDKSPAGSICSSSRFAPPLNEEPPSATGPKEDKKDYNHPSIILESTMKGTTGELGGLTTTEEKDIKNFDSVNALGSTFNLEEKRKVEDPESHVNDFSKISEAAEAPQEGLKRSANSTDLRIGIAEVDEDGAENLALAVHAVSPANSDVIDIKHTNDIL